MPNIENITVPLYSPNDPYHWIYDNLPLKNLMRRQNLINLALDDLIVQTRDAQGTQGSFANRINQSIDEDGNLRPDAVDQALHSMAYHMDDAFGTEVDWDAWEALRIGPFVRMMKDEADKLSRVADEATNFRIYVSATRENDELLEVQFPADQEQTALINLLPSSTITWEVSAGTYGTNLKANLGFPVQAAHRHYYDQIPVAVNLTTPDYIHYKVNSGPTAFVAGSLRIYVNGVRLSKNSSTYVPGALIHDTEWTLLSYTETPASGLFELTAAIATDDVISIDYDIQFAE